MPPTTRRKHWSLSAKLALVGTPFLLPALLATAATLWVSWQLDGGSAAVNEAGRMRMQTYRLSLSLGTGEMNALPQQVKERRLKYVASFGRVVKLVDEGNRDEAVRVMNTETLPLLDAMREPINGLTDLQRRIVVADSEETRRSINAAKLVMALMGVVARVLGIGLSWWISRSITRPLNGAVHVAKTVATGDLGSQIHVESRNETGELLLALKEMNDSLLHIVQRVREGSDAMATAGCPHLERHKIGHQALVEQLQKLQRRYQEGSIAVAAQLSSVLRDWLSLHIRRSDKELIAFMRQRQQGTATPGRPRPPGRSIP